MKLSIALVLCAAHLGLERSANAFAPSQNYMRSCSCSTTSSALFLEVLAKEGEWAAYLDEDNTGRIYYFNSKSGESVWTPPTDTFPEVSLSVEKRVQSKNKIKEYEKEANGGEKNSFLSLVFSSVAAENTKEVQESVEENANAATIDESETPKKWFDGIFDKQTEQNTVIVEDDNAGPVLVEKTAEGKDSRISFSIPNIFGSQEKSNEPSIVDGDIMRKPAVEEQKVEKKPAFPRFGLLELAEKKISKSVKETKPDKQAVDDPEVAASPAFGFLNSLITKEKVMKDEGAIVEALPLQLDAASYVLPHPEKISWGGEDAVFTSGRTFGVFDGVSGAEKLEGIPLYSKTVADEMEKLVGDGGLTTKELTNIMTEVAGFADSAATGATTAVVASITEDGFLRALNLGDSSCWLIRDNKVKVRTKDIVHYFDCPYQLSEDSPDRPRDGTKLNVEVLPGDLVLMATDGVFDNLSDKVILELIADAPSERAFTIAKRIVDLSRKVSLDDEAETPYAKLAKRNGDEAYRDGLGGKVDDTSCVVVRCK